MSPLAHFTFFQCSLFHRYATRHAAEADAPGHARLQPQLAAAHAAPAADAARWPPGSARPALRPARPTDAAARPPAAAAHPCARALRSAAAAAAAGPVPARVHGRAHRPAAGQDDAPEQPRRHDAVRAGPRPAAVHERHAARAGRSNLLLYLVFLGWRFLIRRKAQKHIIALILNLILSITPSDATLLLFALYKVTKNF